jgi:hypothetical protein
LAVARGKSRRCERAGNERAREAAGPDANARPGESGARAGRELLGPCLRARARRSAGAREREGRGARLDRRWERAAAPRMRRARARRPQVAAVRMRRRLHVRPWRLRTLGSLGVLGPGREHRVGELEGGACRVGEERGEHVFGR